MAILDIEAIADRYYADLYRFGLSLAKNEEDAADLTQNAFFLIAKNQAKIRDAERAKSWLFTTLYREFLAKNRRAWRMESRHDIELSAEIDESQPAPSAAHDGKLVLQCLWQLEEEYRATLSLFYLEQLSYQEIAEILQIPIGTVMSRLARGKQKLRHYLEQVDQAEKGRIIPFERRTA